MEWIKIFAIINHLSVVHLFTEKCNSVCTGNKSLYTTHLFGLRQRCSLMHSIQKSINSNSNNNNNNTQCVFVASFFKRSPSDLVVCWLRSTKWWWWFNGVLYWLRNIKYSLNCTGVHKAIFPFHLSQVRPVLPVVYEYIVYVHYVKWAQAKQFMSNCLNILIN